MASWLNAVDVVANVNIALSNATTVVDGVTLSNGMRVLARRQTAAAENGVYDVDTGGVWSRATDFNSATVSNGASVLVKSGTDNAHKVYASDYVEAGFVIDTDPITFRRSNLPEGWFDPTDYGAVSTTGTNSSLAAFVAMFQDMAPPFFGGPFATVAIPPTPRGTFYYFEKTLHITRTCVFQGIGTGESGNGSHLRFAKYAGMVVNSVTNSPDGGSAQGTIIRGLFIEGSHVGADAPEAHTRWQPNTLYSPGEETDLVTPLAARTSRPTNTLAYYYEPLNEGTSGAAEPEWIVLNQGYEVDWSVPWAPGTAYASGSTVHDASAPDRVFFAVIPLGEARTSGVIADRPDFASTPVGDFVDDNGPVVFQWGAATASTLFVTDNEVTWMRRTCCGIYAMTTVTVENVLITGFLNAAFGSVTYSGTGLPPAISNGCKVSNVEMQGCGVGINLAGSDANAMTFINVRMFFNPPPVGQPPDDRRIGILDDSFLGNRFIGCEMDGATGASTYVPNFTAASTFVGTYQEGTSGPNECFAAATSYWGGVVNGFTDTSLFYGAPNPTQWTGVVQNSIDVTGFGVRSTFHDRATHYIYGFAASDTGDAGYAMRYAGAALGQGYWTWEYTAGSWPSLAMTTATSEEGFGLLMHIDGFLAGRSSADRRYTFASADAVTYQQIKYGARTIGDRVVSNSFAKRAAFAERVVISDGFGAPDRLSDYAYNARPHTGPNAAATDMVVAPVNGVPFVFAAVATGTSAAVAPSFNAALPDPVYRQVWQAGAYFDLGASCRPSAANGFVYVVTGVASLPPLSGATEPVWPVTVGLTIGDGSLTWTCEVDPQTASLISDGTVTWQCLGPVASYARTGYIAAEGDVTTVDNAATVLDDFGTVPTNQATRYRVSVAAFDAGNADAKFFDLEAFCVDSGGGPSLVGTASSNVVRDTGAGTTAWTATLALAGSTLQVQVTGETAKTIRWRSQLKMSETL